MSFNSMMNRAGHFWEKRYHSTAFPLSDHRRALNTLRYIHANPKAAGMQSGFFYDFSNYGIYDRLTDDGLTQWHPSFLELGQTLEECAERYRQFCARYRPQPKPERRRRWGSRKFAGFQVGRKSKRGSPGQLAMWEQLLTLKGEEILEVARKFIEANCYDPNDKKQVPGMGFGKA